MASSLSGAPEFFRPSISQSWPGSFSPGGAIAAPPHLRSVPQGTHHKERRSLSLSHTRSLSTLPKVDLSRGRHGTDRWTKSVYTRDGAVQEAQPGERERDGKTSILEMSQESRSSSKTTKEERERKKGPLLDDVVVIRCLSLEDMAHSPGRPVGPTFIYMYYALDVISNCIDTLTSRLLDWI